MDPELPRIWYFVAGALIRKTPSPNSTAVSARSAAINRTRPAGMSRTAEIGLGVSNFCIVLSSCAFRSPEAAIAELVMRRPSAPGLPPT